MPLAHTGIDGPSKKQQAFPENHENDDGIFTHGVKYILGFYPMHSMMDYGWREPMAYQGMFCYWTC